MAPPASKTWPSTPTATSSSPPTAASGSNTAAGTWDDLNGIGLSITQVSGVASNPTNPNNVLASGPILGGDTGVGVSQYSGTSNWQAVDPVTAGPQAKYGGQIYYDPNNANVVYAITGNTLRYSTNAGATWGNVGLAGPGAGPEMTLAVSSLAVGTNQTEMVVAGSNIVDRIVFQYAPVPLIVSITNIRPFAGVFTAVAVATDQGPFTPDPDFPNVTDVGADNPDSGTVYVTDGANLYVTKNAGLTWNVTPRTHPRWPPTPKSPTSRSIRPTATTFTSSSAAPAAARASTAAPASSGSSTASMPA